MMFLLGYNKDIVIYWGGGGRGGGIDFWWKVGNKNLVEGVDCGGYFYVGGMSKYLAGGGDSLPPSQKKKKNVDQLIACFIMIMVFYDLRPVNKKVLTHIFAVSFNSQLWKWKIKEVDFRVFSNFIYQKTKFKLNI